MRSLFDRCSVRVGMSTVPGVSTAHTEAAPHAHHHHPHHAHHPHHHHPHAHPHFQPYNCLVDMELGEGLTGRLLDTHNLLFGDGFSDTLSSRLVSADGNAAYRPWEADHPGDHRAPHEHHHRIHHPLGVTSAPIQVLTHTPPVAAAASSAQMSHYTHTIPTFSSESFPGGPVPPHHVAPQHPVPHKLPPFTAFSPDRSVGSTTPSPLPSFNTLPSPHARYPLVPAPVQAREIPTIQQQMMDERHIRMFESPQGSDPAPSSTTPALASPNTQPPTASSGSASSCSSGSSSSSNSNTTTTTTPHHHHHHQQQQQQHQQQTPYDNSGGTLARLEGSVRGAVKQRAGRAGSLESSESDASVSGTENSGQVSSVSSTAVNNNNNNNNNNTATSNNDNQAPSVPCSEGSFRPPPPQQPPPPTDDPPEKPVKKKRKRCGDCVGCQRKDNCGDCAPCRNDKSHQICKMRRCDKLTEKRTPRGEKMERRQASMGSMMPFFPGPGMGEQPPLPPPEMPPFPHMRERFPNAVWGGEAPQGQWPPPYHPPSLGHPPPMGHPPAPQPHQFNQFEPRQPMFNFPGAPSGPPAPPTPSVPVSQYNSQFNGQFNTGGDNGTAGYVPQGHFSPQTPQTSVPNFANGPPNGFVQQNQGNGVVGGSSPHPHHFPGSNDFHQQQQQQQQQQQGGMFKSPLPSPAVSAPEASPVTGGFTMTTLPSPHAPHTPHSQEHPNEKPGYPPPPPTQSLLGSRVTAGGYSGQALEGGAGVPQGSPHGSVSVQSRLKNMIMSRQSGGFPGGGVDSPPLGEVHFSGHVAAVTSVANAEPAHMQESLKMAQNFLAYRTTEPGPGSVVHANSSDVKGSVKTELVHTSSSEKLSTPIDGSSLQGKNPMPKCENKEMCELRNISIKEEVSVKQELEVKEEFCVKNEPNDPFFSSIECENIKVKDEVREVSVKREFEVKEDFFVKDEPGDPANSIAPEPPDLLSSTTIDHRPEPIPITVGSRIDTGRKLSVYDFPDSPDSNQSSQDFRYGRGRGVGSCMPRPTCGSVTGNTPSVRPVPPIPGGYPKNRPSLPVSSGEGRQLVPSGPSVSANQSRNSDLTNTTNTVTTTTTTTNSQTSSVPSNISISNNQILQQHQCRAQHPVSSSQQSGGVPQSVSQSNEVHVAANVLSNIQHLGTEQVKCQKSSSSEFQDTSQEKNQKHQHQQVHQQYEHQQELKHQLQQQQSETTWPSPDHDHLEQLRQRLRQNELEIPQCSCRVPPGTPDPGPIYSHLGAASSLSELRRKLENQTGHTGPALRMEKVIYTGKEGKTDSGCPMAKWIIRRDGPDEKVLVVVKHRNQHTCNTAWIVIALVVWEGVPSPVADDLYSLLVYKLNKFGRPTERRCGTNEERTCICQGLDQETCGASFSFGCSWSMYYNMCKYARSKVARKFKLSDEQEEVEVEHKLQSLSTILAPVYKQYVPDAFQNQTALESESLECRLGYKSERPWAGVTACADFCAHSHKDNHNMNNGCTVVVTLTKHRGFTKPDDEQLHVLPLYILDPTDEAGSYNNYHQRIQSGALEVLNKYPCEIRVRTEPLLSCRARNLLARGLPLPNRARGRGRGRGRGSGRGKRCSSETKSSKPSVELNDSLGLDTDLTLNGLNNSDSVDLFSYYGIEGSDYSWLLDVGPDNDFGFPSDFDQIISNKDDSTSSDDILASSRQSLAGSNHLDSEKAVGGLAALEGQLNQRQIAPSQTPIQSESHPHTGVSPTSHSGNSPKAVTASVGTSPTTPESSRNTQQSSMPPPQSPAPKRPFSPQFCSSPMSSRSTTPLLPSQSASPNISPLSSPVVRPVHQSSSPCPSPFDSPVTKVVTPSNIALSSSSPYSSPLPSPLISFTPEPQQTVSPCSSPLPCSDSGSVTPSNPTQSPQSCYSLGTSSQFSSPSFSVACTGNVALTPVSSPILHGQGAANPPSSPMFNSQKQLCTNKVETQCHSSQLSLHTPSAAACSMPHVLQNVDPALQMHYTSTNQFSRGPNMQEVMPFHQDRLYSNPFPNVISDKTTTIGEQPCTDKPKEPETIIKFSDNVENFQDPNVGGVAIALTHSSVLFECAKHELHATTALKNPNRRDPKRISLVFYQHKNLIYRNHGWEKFEAKMEKKRHEEEKLIREGKLEPSPRKKKKMMKEGFIFPEECNKIIKTEPEFHRMNGVIGNRQEAGVREVHSMGNKASHVCGQQVNPKPASVYTPSDVHYLKYPDLKSPPNSYVTHHKPLNSFRENCRPYSPSQRHHISPQAPAYSPVSCPPHMISTMASNPRLPRQQITADHSYPQMHHHHKNYGENVRPFNNSLQEFHHFSMSHMGGKPHPINQQQYHHPHQFAHHHHQSPNSDANIMSNSMSSPVHNPMQSPQGNVLHSPYGTPIHSPHGNPMQSPHGTPMHSPYGNPALSPQNSMPSPHGNQSIPMLSPHSNPQNTSMASPHGNSLNNSMPSPHGNPRNPSMLSPHGNPHPNMLSPHGNPHNPNMLSPHCSPHNTSLPSPHGNPHNTSMASPHGNLQNTSVPSSLANPHSSMLSPHSNPHNTSLPSSHGNPHVASMSSPHGNSQNTSMPSPHGNSNTSSLPSPHSNQNNPSMPNLQSNPHNTSVLGQHSNSRSMSLPSPHGNVPSASVSNPHGNPLTISMSSPHNTQGMSLLSPHNSTAANTSVPSPHGNTTHVSVLSPLSSTQNTSQTSPYENIHSTTMLNPQGSTPNPTMTNLQMNPLTSPASNPVSQNPSKIHADHDHHLSMASHPTSLKSSIPSHTNSHVSSMLSNPNPQCSLMSSHPNLQQNTPIQSAHANQGYVNQASQPSYGLAVPYSLGPHGYVSQGTPLPVFSNASNSYTQMARAPAQPTHTWSDMRYAPPFRVTGPSSEWPGS